MPFLITSHAQLHPSTPFLSCSRQLLPVATPIGGPKVRYAPLPPPAPSNPVPRQLLHLQGSARHNLNLPRSKLADQFHLCTSEQAKTQASCHEAKPKRSGNKQALTRCVRPNLRAAARFAAAKYAARKRQQSGSPMEDAGEQSGRLGGRRCSTNFSQPRSFSKNLRHGKGRSLEGPWKTNAVGFDVGLSQG